MICCVSVTSWRHIYIYEGKAVPLQAWSGPEGSRKLRFPDYTTTPKDDSNVVSLIHRPPLPPGNSPGTHFCSKLTRLQGHSAIGRITSMKNSNDTSWDRKKATFRFVAQHLNHCATAVPPPHIYIYTYIHIYIYTHIYLVPIFCLQSELVFNI